MSGHRLGGVLCDCVAPVGSAASHAADDDYDDNVVVAVFGGGGGGRGLSSGFALTGCGSGGGC